MRGYNFAAGPAMLPESILIEAQSELLNWHGLDRSIMEIGHRTTDFTQLLEEAEADLRDLLMIPPNYQVLFLSCPARMQFASIPMNLLSHGEKAGYLISGIWSAMAYAEATKLRQAYCIATSEPVHFSDVPHEKDWQLKKPSSYVYYTPNETVNGTRFSERPEVGAIPLVADMTSCLLTETIHVNDYGLIFAGAQKNIAIPGLTLVIIRDDLLEKRHEAIPTLLDYHIQAQHHSLYATPPTFSCYLAAKMFKWVKAQGGVAAMQRVNRQKAEKLYHYIDTSNFFRARVKKEARSLVNVCFDLNNSSLEPIFLEQANQAGLYALKGHRTVGGLRASLYNAMPQSGVDALIAFMQQFAEDHA